MITAVTPFSPEFRPFLPEEYSGKRTIYFDIETTGLSAQSSYVYLIGCACKEKEGYTLTQWLCTEPAEEKELLRLFFEKAKDFDLVLHYNGTGFDLPFLEKKAKRHCLQNPLSSMESLDLYNTARSMKHLLSLPNLKLKTMEEFFGLTRTDIFSGGDLIEVYAQFLGLHHLNTLTGSKETEVHALSQVLLLHNAEDIKNLPSLTILFFLQQLSAFLEEESLQIELLDTPMVQALTLTYRLPMSFPKALSFSFPWEHSALSLDFSAAAGTAALTLPMYQGELKYFYPNPANYYYLPLEDCAMHKSVASFVEKEYRKKATAATCYTKKTGTFLPLGLNGTKSAKASAASESLTETPPQKKEAQENALASLPCFLSDYKSKFGYTPFTEELLNSKTLLTALAKELLRTLL